jgi:predicted GIY-YIG superfamily endonuclease
MKYYVYRLTSTNGLVYYGKTKRPQTRKYQHDGGHGACTSKKLYKNGGCVDMKILDIFDDEDLALVREKFYINNYDCVNKNDKGVPKRILSREKQDENNRRLSEKIKCDNCGTQSTRRHLSQHKQSNKCKTFNKSSSSSSLITSFFDPISLVEVSCNH